MGDEDDSPSIVLESGRMFTKVGVAGEDAPKLNFPTVVGYPPEMAHLQIKPGETWKGKFSVGEEAERQKGTSLLKSPISEGLVKDWDAMEKVWQHAFKELMVTPAEEYNGVLLTDSVTNPKDGRERMTHLMFEKFHLPKFYIAAQAMLAMYGAGRTTGVTIDAGEDFVHCVPLLEGYPLLYAAQKLPVAGKHITASMVQAMKGMGIEADTASARDLKEKACRVALDYDSELQKAAGARREFTLPDGAKVSLGEEQVKLCEVLFQPGPEHLGLHRVTHKVVLDCDYGQRNELWNNLLLVGGTSLHKNIRDRLQAELGALAPSSARVEVTAMPERSMCSWQGGSILASLNTFNQMWINKEEYDESGPSIVHRKCI